MGRRSNFFAGSKKFVLSSDFSSSFKVEVLIGLVIMLEPVHADLEIPARKPGSDLFCAKPGASRSEQA
jgi:hypothetical protein